MRCNLIKINFKKNFICKADLTYNPKCISNLAKFYSCKKWVLHLGCIIVSPNGARVSLAVRLEFVCTNIQAQYEPLWHDLEYVSC
jgi:hypothetical protein